jgi:hypothetical protein
MTVLLILIIVLAAIIVAIARYSGHKVSVHLFKWIAGAYGFILIAGLFALYLLPADQLLQGSVTQPQIVSGSDFYELGGQGKFDQTEGIHGLDLQTFDYSGEKLVVDSDGGISVFAKRKNTDDGIIAAKFYTSISTFSGLDVSDKVKPPLVTLQNGILKIRFQECADFKYYSFRYELPIRQFLTVAEKEYDNSHEMNIALYLEIPKNMQIEGLDYGVIIVDKEGR